MKRPGMARQRWIEPIDNFVREFGYDTPRWAIICTYECDLAILERRVLPSLNRRGRTFRTLVLADAGALEAQLNVSRASQAQVNLHPVRIQGRGVFHPKLVFLRAGERARVCFGSANISSGGLGANLEVWTHSDDPGIIGGIVDFLHGLQRHPRIQLDRACERQLNRAVIGFSPRVSTRVWTSLNGSFEACIHIGRRAHSRAVTLVSPICTTQNGLARARTVFPSANVTVYGDLEVAIPGALTRYYSPPNRADYDPGEQPDYPSRLHAKLYVIERQMGEADVWVGSANFTEQALTKSVSKGGNVELMVHAVMLREELKVLRTELNSVFEKAGCRVITSSRDFKLPVPRSTILACELQIASSGLRLVVYAAPGTRSVTLEHHDSRVTIKIRNGVGLLGGQALHATFPELSGDRPQFFVVYQVTGESRIPVVVNSPYISKVADGLSQASLDDLLDELRGHVRKPQLRDEIDEAAHDSEDDAEFDIDQDMVDSERRLDEVKHQGMLDQLAVKAALALRLIMKSTVPGALRQELLVLARRSFAVACPPALRPILEEWLSQ